VADRQRRIGDQESVDMNLNRCIRVTELSWLCGKYCDVQGIGTAA
jgi:hypothetical protein